MRSILTLAVALPLFQIAFVQPTPAQEKAALVQLEHSHYPLKVGNRWIYRANQGRVTIDVVRRAELNRSKEKEKATEKVIGYELLITNGSSKVTEQVVVLEDGVYRVSAGGRLVNPPIKFLNMPAKAGERWACDSKSDDETLRGSYATGQSLTKTPMGQFDTITVVSRDFQSSGQPMEIDYWFAKGVGMVKQRLKIGQTEVVLELEQFIAAK